MDCRVEKILFVSNTKISFYANGSCNHESKCDPFAGKRCYFIFKCQQFVLVSNYTDALDLHDKLPDFDVGENSWVCLQEK